jgi:hypothetical protein
MTIINDIIQPDKRYICVMYSVLMIFNDIAFFANFSLVSMTAFHSDFNFIFSKSKYFVNKKINYTYQYNSLVLSDVNKISNFNFMHYISELVFDTFLWRHPMDNSFGFRLLVPEGSMSSVVSS